MEEKFSNYIESIGITNALIPRIEHVIETLENISKEKIIDIFISEYMQENGTRNYEDFRSFSKNYYLCAFKFLHTDDYAILHRSKKIFNAAHLEFSNYDFISASSSSRLNIRLDTTSSLWKANLLKASGNNCDKLFSFFNEYLVKQIG